MPKNNDYPIPKKRFHGGRWRIYWKWNFKQYSIPTRHRDATKTTVVDADLRYLSAALAMPCPVFPEQYQASPAVISYLDDRRRADGSMPGEFSPETWLGDYKHEIEGKNTAEWVRDSLSMLKRLGEKSEGLENVTENKAAAYMAALAKKRTAGTHNRTLTVFKKFYKWLVNTKRHATNPFAHVKRMNEGRETSIVYCTAEDRDEIIVLAWATGWTEWLAVVIAFYTGMRREEIANLRWENINFASASILIRKTKTKTSRTIPMNAVLERVLAAEDGKTGYVVECPEGLDRLIRLNTLARVIQKAKRTKMLDGWKIKRPQPSRSKEYPAQKIKYDAQKKARADDIEEALARIGWNAWRHTFGSLLAQGGVSIDKISAWMGNTPEVCRRHYAQFIPRDRRDSEIDKL